MFWRQREQKRLGGRILTGVLGHQRGVDVEGAHGVRGGADVEKTGKAGEEIGHGGLLKRKSPAQGRAREGSLVRRMGGAAEAAPPWRSLGRDQVMVLIVAGGLFVLAREEVRQRRAVILAIDLGIRRGRLDLCEQAQRFG